MFDGMIGRSLEFDFFKYHDFVEIEEWLKNIDSPLASLESAGKTYENRDIYVVTIGDDSQPKIAVDCGIHAREWVSPPMCLYLIEQLLNGDYKELTDGVTWVIFPILNPDGYQYTWSDGGTNPAKRFWRKNRRVNDGTSCIGVDLNRNYDVKWNQAGTSSSPCSYTYGGTSAFSEAESKAHSDHVNKLADVQAYLTFHAYGTLLLYPYSASRFMDAHNKEELHDLAKEYSSRTKAVNNEFYRYGEGADIFGAVSGGSDDWAHKSGIPISYTIELRDRGQFKFALPESMIEPTLKENMEGIRAIFDHVSKASADAPNETTKKMTSTEQPKTTEDPKIENNCICFSLLESQAEQQRRDAILTCLPDKTTTTKMGHKLIYVSAECGKKKIKTKKIVCKEKNNVWLPKKNPFTKIINKKC
ncbi:unnamed protein product [Oikopleura dioica]|uniref:Peptidase M14 domain-containing protein n=1 Tax=Oikopleura dioica TaxID=34765 RepID=E4Y5R7_OIKDI|nr:unnamed protein product [Oikopleura dioica]